MEATTSESKASRSRTRARTPAPPLPGDAAGHFEILQAPMAIGRSITGEDTASSRHVAVINEAFAKKFFKGENPLGKHFGSGDIKHAGDYEVVGVVKDIRYIVSDRDSITPMYYLPEAQTIHYDKPDDNVGEGRSHYLYNIVVWAPGSPAGLGTSCARPSPRLIRT